MKIQTEVVTKENIEVSITPEELAKEIGKILSGYHYHIYDCEPSFDITDNGDSCEIDLYKSEVAWDGVMQIVFAKDIAKVLQEYSKGITIIKG